MWLVRNCEGGLRMKTIKIYNRDYKVLADFADKHGVPLSYLISDLVINAKYGNYVPHADCVKCIYHDMYMVEKDEKDEMDEMDEMDKRPLSSLGDYILEHFRKPLPGELADWVSVGNVIERLRKPVPNHHVVGRAMRSIGFQRKRTASRVLYNVVSVQKGVEDGEV